MGSSDSNINKNCMISYGNDQADNQYQIKLEYDNQLGSGNNNYMGSYCNDTVKNKQNENQRRSDLMNRTNQRVNKEGGINQSNVSLLSPMLNHPPNIFSFTGYFTGLYYVIPLYI